MSRVGKQIIEIPNKTTVTMDGGVLTVKGPLGELKREFKDVIAIAIGDKDITLSRKEESPFTNALWGTYASHIQNMISGVNKPYVKTLILEGVGYKADLQGKTVVLSIGFSHKVNVPVPDGIEMKAEKNVMTISGIDKEKVGQFAAMVRALKKPEPYKGKGMRYSGEVIRRKQGKKSV